MTPLKICNWVKIKKNIVLLENCWIKTVDRIRHIRTQKRLDNITGKKIQISEKGSYQDTKSSGNTMQKLLLHLRWQQREALRDKIKHVINFSKKIIIRYSKTFFVYEFGKNWTIKIYWNKFLGTANINHQN